MADYYTSFVMEVPNLSTLERIWFEAELSPALGTEEEWEPWAKARGLEPTEVSGSWPGFESHFPDKTSLILSSGESGDVENLGNLLGRFLHQFRPNQRFIVPFANTCSRMRLDGFGGGCVVAYPGGHEVVYAQDAAEARLKEIEHERKALSARRKRVPAKSRKRVR